MASATSRLETILKANKIAFRALDCATDEKARTLWSRRSKGRKLPGLVKYGQVIGDLEEVEEWNEYGEIKENIDNVSDLFGDTPTTDTPMPPPAPITMKNPLATASGPPSRSSSETRHISISEPKARDNSGSNTSSARTSRDETPLSLAMRQAGAEAAAKAGQRKASATASAVPAKRDVTEITPITAATKMSIEVEDPAEATQITAGKTPAVLAAEGASKTVDKSEDDSTSSSASPTEGKSNEEQMLEARRASSIAKVPSRLQQETSIDDVKTSVPEQAVTSETNLPDTAPKVSETQPRLHRGSSISEASAEEIKEIEKKNAIPEVSEEEGDTSSEDDDNTAVKKAAPKSTVQATDEAEAKVMKGSKTEDQGAKDADAAGVSAAAALFLSPNSIANPNRLSADSTSVYSFFDSAFSPAPLFSGTQNLDLDLSFIEGAGLSDPRTSVSTYATDDADLPPMNHSTDTSVQHNRTPRHSEDARQSESKYEQASIRKGTLLSIPNIAPLRTPARRQVSEPLLSHTINRDSTPVPLPLNIRRSPTEPSTSPSSQAHSRTSSGSNTRADLPAAPSATPPSQASSRGPSNSTTRVGLPKSVRSQPQLPTQQLNQTSNSTQPQENPQTDSLFSSTSISTVASPTSTGSVLSPTSISTSSSPATPTPATPLSSNGSESRSLRFKKSIRSLRSKKSTQMLNSSSPTNELPPNLSPQRQLREIQQVRSVSDTYVTMEGKRREKSGMKNLLCF